MVSPPRLLRELNVSVPRQRRSRGGFVRLRTRVAAVISAPSRRDALVALATYLVALALFVALPAVAAADPTTADGVPAAWSTPWVVVLVLITVQAIVLAWVSSAPNVAVVVIAALPLAAAPTEPGAAFGTTAFAVLIVVVRVVAAKGPWRSRWALSAAFLLVAAGLLVAEDPGAPPLLALGQALSIVAVPAVLGSFLASQRATREAQRAEIQALAREREALVQAALARERTTMARELHDIAAHHLSGIALMAGAVGRQIDSDPSAAKVGVDQLRTQATAVLGDLRRLVGLMRTADHQPGAGTGVESVAGITRLVTDHPGDTTLEAPEEPRVDGIGPLAQLAAYRTVQEALANATRHATGAPCVVMIEDEGEALTVTVRNGPPAVAPAPSGAPGFGLLGMRERADLTGSDLRHGPTPDGGWEVVLRVPRDPSEVAE